MQTTIRSFFLKWAPLLLALGVVSAAAAESIPAQVEASLPERTLARALKTPEVPSQLVTDDVRLRLEASFQTLTENWPNQAQGLSVAVLIPGCGYWLAQKGADGHGGYVTDRTRFHAAGASHLLTAALVVEGAATGATDLAAGIDALLPNLPEAWRSLSLDSLLTQTSGLGSFNDTAKYNPWLSYNAFQLIGLTPSHLSFLPGENYKPSRTGELLLGMALEHVNGVSWEDQISKTFFAPLASSGALTAKECKAGDLAVGHVSGISVAFRSDAAGSGSVVASPFDLARIYDSILNARAISTDAAALLYGGQMTVQNDEGMICAGRGFQWVEKDGSTLLVSQGWIDGFATTAGMAADSGVTIVVMANDSNYSTDACFYALARVVAEAAEPMAVAEADEQEDIPSIDRQPSNDTVTAGWDAHFSLDASHVRDYRWQRQNGDGSWTNLNDDFVYHNTRSRTLTVSTSLSLDGERYRCVVSNSAGSVESRIVTLYVNRHNDHDGRHGGGAVSPWCLILLGVLGAARWFQSRRH